MVEWYEGAVEKLSGPPLLRIADHTNHSYYARCLFTAALGMPIATEEREADDAQGSVALFFHENMDKHGNTSAKVFGVSNCHVLRRDTTVTYEFRGAGAPPQRVRLAGFRRFKRALDEIKTCISNHRDNAELLAKEIVQSEATQDEKAIGVRRKNLAQEKKDIGVLEAFYHDIDSQWGAIARRNIGRVDWAPEISVDVGGRRYTKDIGTFEVDPVKFRDQFKGNVVDLGAFCLIFLIITSNKNNIQDPSLLPGNSPTCSALRVLVGQCSSSLSVASSGSTVVSRATCWLFPTATTATEIPALS